MAGIIASDLERLGMKVNFRSLEFNTLVRKLTSTFDWEAILIGLTGGIEPHGGKNVWNSAGQLHMWHPLQKEPATEWEKQINDLFNQGVQELDENERKKIYDEFQMIVSENLPLIYTVVSKRMLAARNKFMNLKPAKFGGALHNVDELIIKEEYR